MSASKSGAGSQSRRSMTFTGCWTCKRRKVKCDERPTCCRNCERIGVACDSYGVRLQWISSGKSSGKSSGGRVHGRILIGRDHGPVYDMKTIDAFLVALEEDVTAGRESRRGPFSAMQLREEEAGVEEITTAEITAEIIAPQETTTMAMTLHFAFSPDPSINQLMHHYILHVAGLLQPIDHPLNPYRTLYVPAALTAAAGPAPYGQDGLCREIDNGIGISTGLAIDTAPAIHAVLLHALLASSAFHLYNCCPDQPAWLGVGAQHHRTALSLLRSAVRQAARAAQPVDYQSLMMALLSLVSVDIMSGGTADFVVHLRGTKQLQRGAQRRRPHAGTSHTTRQLNQMSDFLFLLARTTQFGGSSRGGGVHADTDTDTVTTVDSDADSCYPYMYGIAPTLAAYMDETCRLAEQRLLAGPYALQGDCDALTARIRAWTVPVTDPDDAAAADASTRLARAIFRPHAEAWQRALVLYAARRLDGGPAPDRAVHVRVVAACMHAVEDTKEAARATGAAPMAPITWPAFVAACEGLERAAWTRWWTRVVERYRIGNIRRQWETVQRVWAGSEGVDGEEADGPGADWIAAFQEYGWTLMPI